MDTSLSVVSAEHFRSLILHTESVLIMVLDLSGRILVFNRASEVLTGISSSTAIGRFFWEISNAPEESQAVRKFFKRLLKRRFPETHDRAWRAADNSQRLLRWSLNKITNEQGSELLVAVGYDITELDQAQKQVAQHSSQLAERVKELGCLYSITRLGERSGLVLDEFLQGVIELIPPAWQFPDYACAELTVEEHSYQSANFSESTICQQCSIVIENQQIGLVRVYYAAGFPGDSKVPFLEEEEHLLDSITDAIRRVVLNYRAGKKITDYQVRLRSLASELALTGERERRRIAQQLHDNIGHNLALLKYKLGEQRSKLPGDDWEQLTELLETCIQASRTLTFELSPPVLHELGLCAALEWLSHQLETNYGIACSYEDDHQPMPLSEDLRVEVFQAVRELLTNVGKHSQASEAWIKTQVDGASLIVTIGDNGIGFDINKRRMEPRRLGWGLFSIRERLAHLGGKFTVKSAPGQGTELTLSVSLEGDELIGIASPPSQATPSVVTTSGRNIRILLADDQQLTRAGLRSLLERERGLEVIGEAGTGEEAVNLAKELKPNVVVMDVAMPEVNGIEATRRIVAADPEIKVIGLSMHSDGQYVLEMLRAGATGYLLKDCAQEDLAQAIRIVQANLTFLSPGLTDSVASHYVEAVKGIAEDTPEQRGSALKDSIPELTPREIEVLVLLAKGKTTKQSAIDLGISVKTVETHRQHVMEKLGDNSIAGLTRFAILKGLINLEWKN